MKQEFENILDWIDFIIKSGDNELKKLITEDFTLDDKIKDQLKIENDKAIIDFKSRLQGHEAENKIWDETLHHYPQQLPDEICLYLIKNNIAVTALGHTRQSDKIMWILGKQVEEAALTLGKEIYHKDSYSLDDLKRLLETFYDMHWLWNSLIFENPSNSDKLDFFNQFLDSRDDFIDIKERKIELEVDKLLKQTDSVELITKYFNENNPVYYLSISQNPNSPIDFLTELKDVKDIKFARNIRNFAIENIKNRTKNAL